MSKPESTPRDGATPKVGQAARVPGGFPRTRARWLIGLALGCAVFGLGIIRSGSQEQKPVLDGPTIEAAPKTRFPVRINRPGNAPQVATGLTNFQGDAAVASCASCHTTTKPSMETRSAAELDQFHQGLKYAHGDLTCLSCHNSNNYETLRLADGRSLEFSDSMALCSQCHGPQRRDYDRGLHGGMNGYWDLARGGRTRNTCIDCHDPHAPAFPAVLPVLPPRDRISVPHRQGSDLGQNSRMHP